MANKVIRSDRDLREACDAVVRKRLGMELEFSRNFVGPPLPPGHCHWCGYIGPLDTSYSDEGHGWPFCPVCKGV